jgi:hypothetical protein
MAKQGMTSPISTLVSGARGNCDGSMVHVLYKLSTFVVGQILMGDERERERERERESRERVHSCGDWARKDHPYPLSTAGGVGCWAGLYFLLT